MYLQVSAMKFQSVNVVKFRVRYLLRQLNPIVDLP
jgi:hypothetical protein